jgi:hypothetical protein
VERFLDFSMGMADETSGVPSPDEEALQQSTNSALDEAAPDGARLTEILDGIPGAWERAQVSIKQARRGETVPLSEL